MATDIPKIGAPALRALLSIKVQQLSDLTKFTETEISELHGMGPKAIKILKRALKNGDLSFKN